MKRRIPVLLLIVVMLFTLALAACGNTTDPKNGTPANTADNKSNSKASGNKVVLEFWATKFEDTTDAWFKKWVDEYNKIQDKVEVKLTIVPGDAWDQKMKAAQAAGKAPDLRTLSYNGIVPSVQQSQIMALDDYTDPAIWADLYGNIEEFVMVNGQHYAYPKLVEPSAVLYYNKNLFTAAGLDPEKPPVTWDELIEYGQKLTKDGVYGVHIANNAGEYSWTSWGLQMGAAGHRPISEDWSEAVVDQGYVDLITFYKQLYDLKIAPAQALTGYTDMADFGQEKVAMSVNGSWGIGQLRNDYKDILDHVGVAKMPTKDGDPNKASASLGGWTLVVDGKAKNPQEAADFISWFLAGDPEIMIDFFKTSQFSKFPARRSVDEALNEHPEASQDEVRKLIAEKIVPTSVSEPTYPWDVSFKIGEAIERATKGQDPKEAAEQANKEINEFIKQQDLASKHPNQ